MRGTGMRNRYAIQDRMEAVEDYEIFRVPARLNILRRGYANRQHFFLPPPQLSNDVSGLGSIILYHSTFHLYSWS